MAMAPHQRIIFPLDVPSLDDAVDWVERLHPHVGLFKVGLELFCAVGPEAVRQVTRRCDAGVFLDLKLLDIPATVERAACAVARLGGVKMLTVHASGGPSVLQAAVRGAGSSVCVLAVTRLTSATARVEEVVALARTAAEAGCGGIVCSGAEAREVRDAIGPDLVIVCPGVRPRGSEAGDQVRVATPRRAMESGADYLVIGRPIRDASNPVHVVQAVAEEIANGP